MLTALLTAVCCTEMAAQERGPKVLSDNKVAFTLRAPEAQKVQVDIGGVKYDMAKGEGGVWSATTDPQVPGFHYYSLIIDGVSVADPASPSYFGCGRWSSAIDIPEAGMDDFEVQAVPHGEVRTVHYFSNVGVFSTGMFGGIRGAVNFDLEKEVPGILSDTKTFNQQFDVFFVSCGEQDPRIEYTRNIVKTMRDGGVEVKFNSYPGDHEWQVWRKSLHEFAQYLFK